MSDHRPIELVGGFETTYLPAHDRDVAETTEHDVRWRDDLGLLRQRSGASMAPDLTRPGPRGATRPATALPADDGRTTIRGAQRVAGTAVTTELPYAEAEVST